MTFAVSALHPKFNDVHKCYATDKTEQYSGANIYQAQELDTGLIISMKAYESLYTRRIYQKWSYFLWVKMWRYLNMIDWNDYRYKKLTFAKALILSGSLKYTPRLLSIWLTTASSRMSPTIRLPNKESGLKPADTRWGSSDRDRTLVSGFINKTATSIWREEKNAFLYTDSTMHQETK